MGLPSVLPAHLCPAVRQPPPAVRVLGERKALLSEVLARDQQLCSGAFARSSSAPTLWCLWGSCPGWRALSLPSLGITVLPGELGPPRSSFRTHLHALCVAEKLLPTWTHHRSLVSSVCSQGVYPARRDS